MCWGSNCRHIINSQNSQQGVGGWDPFDCNLSGNIVFPGSLCFANSASILPAQGGLGDRFVSRMDSLCLQSGLLAPSTPTKSATSPRAPLLYQPNHQPFTNMVDCFNMVSQGHQSCLEGSGNHLDRECVEGGPGLVGESTGVAGDAGPRGGSLTAAKTPSHLPSHTQTTALCVITFQVTAPLPDLGGPPKMHTASQSLASQSTVWGPAALARLLEMQQLGPHPEAPEAASSC